MKKIISSLAMSVLLLIATNTNATIIDFEEFDIPPNSNFVFTQFSSEGFVFSNTIATDDLLVIYNGSGYCVGGCFNNGGNVLSIFNSDGQGPFEMVMGKASGGTFDLLNFDTAPLFDSIGDGNQNLSLSATLADGSTLDWSLTYDNLIGAQVATPNFRNVTSVLFRSNAFWSSIDNINVSTPNFIALFTMSVAALIFVRRRNLK